MATAVKTAVGPTILLQSGHYFDLLDPHSSLFTIEDIAHGLANTCRFAGQCRGFYSVAEHAIHVSRLVPAELALPALLHDAAEAFIGDVTRPLKTLLPEYKAIERNIQSAIELRFRVTDCDHAEIKKADLQLLAAEQAELMPPHDDCWPVLAGVEQIKLDFRMWTPGAARQHFMARYLWLREQGAR